MATEDKEQKIYKELDKIGGPLANDPLKRWLACGYLPWTLFGLSGCGILLSSLFVSSTAHQIQAFNDKKPKSAQEISAKHKIDKYHDNGRKVLLLSIANFIFWGCAVIGATKKLMLEEQAVELMLKIKEKLPNTNIDVNQARQILMNVPYIISKMSAEERVYFDALMQGSIDMADDLLFKDLALRIMMGHLEKHSEDMAKMSLIFKANAKHFSNEPKQR